MPHRGKVDVAGGLAAGAPDLKPGEAGIDGLVDVRRGIDRLAVGPHPFVPAFAKELVGLLQHGLGFGPDLGRLRGEDVGHRARLPELLVESLAVAARQWCGVMFRRHPTSSRKMAGARGQGVSNAASNRRLHAVAAAARDPQHVAQDLGKLFAAAVGHPWRRRGDS